MSISGQSRSRQPINSFYRQQGVDASNLAPPHSIGHRRSFSTSTGYYMNGVSEVAVSMPPLKRKRFSSSASSSSSSSSSSWQYGAGGIEAQYRPSNGVIRRDCAYGEGPSTSNNLLSYQKPMDFRLGVPHVNACAFPVSDKSDSMKLAVDEDPIFMSKDEIERRSPSRKDGIDVRKETHLRHSYCAFLQNLGIRLALPQTTIATAMVLCHRFFLLRSHACHDRFLVATATLFLASKSEETPTQLNNVVKASSEICHKQSMALYPYMFNVEWYAKYREAVIETEQMILTTLDFELNVQHPYTHLMSVLNKLGFTQSILASMAWNVVSQGLRSSLWLQFKPNHIAAGAAFLAAQFLNIDLGSCQGIWQEFQTSSHVLQDVTKQLMEVL